MSSSTRSRRTSEISQMSDTASDSNATSASSRRRSGYSRLPVSYGIVLFPGFQALDVFGPLDILNTLSLDFKIRLHIIAATPDPVSTRVLNIFNPMRSNCAQSIVPTHTFETAPRLDVLIVPGGIGYSTETQNVVDFIARVYPSLRYLFTVCTGSAITARTGILDGRRAATAKAGWARTTASRPQVDWVPHARWIVDGNIWSSSGVSAGIDAMYAFVEEIYGEEAAATIAAFSEYERRKDPRCTSFADFHGIPCD